MDLTGLLSNSLWAALFGIGMAVLFSAPKRALIPSFCCAFLARFLRDALIGWGSGLNLATFVAAAIVSLVAFGVMPRRGLSPVVAAAGLIPLGAAGALFRAIDAFLGTHSLRGETITDVDTAAKILSNCGILFATTCSIAVGTWAGYVVWESIRRDEFGA
jgi:uncharacterized membrane protein YjjB (DUF3815 family)